MTDRLRRLYGAAELAPLWRELWRRYSSGAPVTAVRLRGLTDPQRFALADLLGLDRLPPPELTVRVSALEAATSVDTRTLVEALIGPLDNRAERRAAAATERRALWSWLATHPVIRSQPALEAWAASVQRTGLIDGSTDRTRHLLDMALTVLAALPSDGRPLPRFAAQICHDTHALDDGTRLSTLVLRALAALHDEPPPSDAEQRRALWERAGVACDALSTTVLTAGLQPAGDSPLAQTLRLWSAAGNAAVITLAQLQHHDPLTLTTAEAYVVENPSILAMALRRFGHRCPPMVATSGWPNSAGILLLRTLRASGVTLHYHGDFDGEGLRIAAYVMSRTGARPWRLSTADYLASVRPECPDPGTITDAPWDPALADALRHHRATVSEEHVADHLLDDLSAALQQTR